MSLLPQALAAAFVFAVSDLVYVLDHYFVHHDRERYARTHGRHHRRYNGPKDGPHLDRGERATYNSAGLASCVGASVLSLYTGNPGFLAGALAKWAHSLLFHLYQHRWWGEVPIVRQGVPRPGWRWGLATARYHAYHHAQPNDTRFTYAESWAGFDRLLEWAHPWLVRFTVDGRRARLEGQAAAPRAGRALPPDEEAR
jgi:hypothetical protein